MKVIDAHLHWLKNEYAEQIAKEAEQENTEEFIRPEYKRLNIVHGVVMGNLSIHEIKLEYPDLFSYCAPVGAQVFDIDNALDECEYLEEHLKQDRCVGIKLYAGYGVFNIVDNRLDPVYKLAEKYDKPVAIHTGLTASADALLKYSHPLLVDEVATRYPKVNFVMCHFGEPWFVDAAAVLAKNSNVCADLSGILVGRTGAFETFLMQNHCYLGGLTGWLGFVNDYSRFMFGTDWPLANLEDYIEFTKYLIPEEHWEKVFYKNAKRIYHLK